MNPNQNQLDQAAIAHEEFTALTNRLVSEGFDYRSMLSGAAAAIAQSITASAGPDKAADWFAGQALLLRQMQGPSN